VLTAHGIPEKTPFPPSRTSIDVKCRCDVSTPAAAKDACDVHSLRRVGVTPATMQALLSPAASLAGCARPRRRCVSAARRGENSQALFSSPSKKPIHEASARSTAPRAAYAAAAAAAAAAESQPKVVGVGSAGVDYLASVASFPEPDAKLRTDALDIQGGGNCGRGYTRPPLSST